MGIKGKLRWTDLLGKRFLRRVVTAMNKQRHKHRGEGELAGESRATKQVAGGGSGVLSYRSQRKKKVS